MCRCRQSGLDGMETLEPARGRLAGRASDWDFSFFFFIFRFLQTRVIGGLAESDQSNRISESIRSLTE